MHHVYVNVAYIYVSFISYGVTGKISIRGDCSPCCASAANRRVVTLMLFLWCKTEPDNILQNCLDDLVARILSNICRMLTCRYSGLEYNGMAICLKISYGGSIKS